MNWLDGNLGLRLILLAGGILLIAVLIWLDRRRRQAGGSGQPASGRGTAGADTGAGAPESRDETLVVARAVGRDNSAHRPLPVIDWSALERDDVGGESEARLAVHTMSADAPAEDAARHQELLRGATAAVPPSSPSIDHWPPEETRRICSLRIAPPAGERFSGRILRQGLQGAGFVHGVLGVFHLADDQGRALISAANLARPGQLDPAIMDFQRFGGLHLFSVMPGPVPDAQLLGQLFNVTTELAGRVGGAPQDERGAPLTSVRKQELFQQYVRATMPADPPAA